MLQSWEVYNLNNLRAHYLKIYIPRMQTDSLIFLFVEGVDIPHQSEFLSMGLIVLKKIGLLFLLISASLLSTSFAGRQWTSMDNPTVETTNEGTTRKPLHSDEATEVQERLLKANTNDYGKFNPSPTFVKPPFKLIPN
ncbi:hypothetical protein NE237_018582 [Protea cynaroides]|uniref:Uncharacterized protein n=1 Tax=Protea cynaroides TaxID=273540 RepID=A0A9Q0QP55_9MAGN|nr:hypothetical protein NE237_018582 [Protea cynaroides]